VRFVLFSHKIISKRHYYK